VKIYLIKDEGMLHKSGFPVYYLSTSPLGSPGKPLPEVKMVEEFELKWIRGERKFFEELISWGVLGVDTPNRRKRLIEREQKRKSELDQE